MWIIQPRYVLPLKYIPIELELELYSDFLMNIVDPAAIPVIKCQDNGN